MGSTAVVNAILNAKHVIPYQWSSLLESIIPRDGTKYACVYGVSTVDNLQTQLLQSRWVPCEHDSLLPDQRGYMTKDMCGRQNKVLLRTLPEDHPVKLYDRLQSNRVIAHVMDVEAATAHCASVVVGKLYDVVVVLSIHIGNIMTLSSVEAQGRHGEVITARDAIAMGLEVAKIV